jgi:hypothetical protein
MTSHGYQRNTLDPFGVNRLQADTSLQAGPGASGRNSRQQQGEMNTLATLSVVFAFVFAPVGAVMGHLALSQIKHFGQRGRDRALIGLTLSYVFMLFVVVALVIWALTDHGDTPATVSRPSVTIVPAPAPPAAMPPQTTVVTPAPPVRRTANVEDLHIGDCVEIQQTAPDPNDPGAQQIKIYPVNCQVRDGIFRVDQVAPNTSACTDEYLTNQQRNLFACISKFGGGV